VNIRDDIIVTAENAGVSVGIQCYVNITTIAWIRKPHLSTLNYNALSTTHQIITIVQHTALRQAALCVRHEHLFL
jgi:hypothetical protein